MTFDIGNYLKLQIFTKICPMLSVTDFKYRSNCYNRFSAHKKFEHVQSISTPWESMGRVKIKMLLGLAVGIAVLLSAQLVFASNLSTDGQNLTIVEAEISLQETENLNLRSQIAKVSSLKKLSERAQTLGFQPPDKVITP